MKKLSDLLIEMLRADPLMKSAHDVIDRYFNKNVTEYINQLENIRDINDQTPTNLIDDSIRLIGMDIPNWIMKSNGENVRKCFYHLTQVYQVAGVYGYPKFIEFLLGRGFRVVDLYTQDYVNFYPEPKGRLVHQGGAWFSTTHVDLEVDISGIVSHYPLVIGDGDVEWIKNSLNYDKLPQWKKDDINNDINLMIENGTVYGVNDAVYAYAVLDKRIIDLFYQFAPIEEVVRGIYMTIVAKARLIMTMTVVEEGIDFVELDPPDPLQVILELNSMLNAGTEYKYYARVIWSNDSQTLEPVKITWADHPYTLVGSDKIVFGEVEDLIRRDVNVEYKCVGRKLMSRITVYQGGVELVPASVMIQGQSILREGSTGEYKVFGDYRGPQGDTKIREIYDVENVKFYSTSEDIVIDGFNISVKRIFEDKNIVVFAEYETSEGMTLGTQLPIRLMPIPKSVLPIDLQNKFYKQTYDANGVLLGEVEELGDLVQGQTYRLETVVTYSDTTSSIVKSDTNVSTPAISIDSDNKFYPVPTGSTYPCDFVSSYNEGQEKLVASEKRLIVFPQIEMLSLTISGSDTIVEGTTQRYTVLANWSNGQISSVPDSVLTSKQAILGSELLYELDVASDGSVTAPVLGQSRPAILSAKTQRYTDGQWVSAQRIINVQNINREPVTLDVIMSEVVNEGNSIPLFFYANWTNGKRTQILPNKVSLKQGNTLLCSMLRQNENSPELTSQFAFGGLYIQNDPVSTFMDMETNTECKQVNLVYDRPAQTKGLISLNIEYTDPTSNKTVNYERIFTAVSYVVTPIAIELDTPTVMEEGSRYFVRAIVTYEDGSQKDVEANWQITDTVGDVDDLDADISSGLFTLDQIVQSLIGFDKAQITSMALSNQDLDQKSIKRLIDGEVLFKDMGNRPILGQTWPQKLAILFQQYEDLMPRCVVQSRFVDEDAKFVLTCSFYALRDQKVVDVINKPTDPVNPIKNWYITGDVEIDANLYNFYSYGLIVNYDDNGVEYLVSNDWEAELYSDETFNQRRELIRSIVDRDGDSILPMDNDGSGRKKTVDELTEEEMIEIMPTSSVVDIDQNGYLYPRINENVRVVIKAIYNDGQQQFEETLTVYIRKQNTRLRKIEIAMVSPTGSLTYDFKDKITDKSNTWAFISLEGVVYYQFKAFLTRFGEPDPVELTRDVFWKAEPIGTGVSFDEQSGKLYILPQANDSEITIVARYEEEFRESETSSTVFLEEIKSRSVVQIFAHKALDAINIAGSLHTSSDTVYYPSVDIVRRDGSMANQNVLTWAYVEGPSDITLTADGLGFIIPKRTTDTTMKIRAVATEGLRVIRKDIVVNILASFVPLDLHVNSNPSGMRDNSQYFLKAFLEMRDGSSYEATSECYWLLDTSLNGLSIGNKTGVLTIPPVDVDTTIVIRCVYTRNELTYEKKHTMTIQSSYPIYWIDVAQPINNNMLQTVISDETKFKRLLSQIGGKFTVLPNANEYAYFATKKTNGRANVAIVPSSSGQVNWGGMQNPVEVTRTYLDGTSEAWNVYRSNNRGFGVAEFSVTYGQ